PYLSPSVSSIIDRTTRSRCRVKPSPAGAGGALVRAVLLCRGTVDGLSCWNCITATPTFWHDRGPVHTEMGTTRSRSGNELRRERSDRAYGRHRPGAHSDGGSSGESPSWSARKRSKCSPISSAVGRSIVVASGEESSPSPRESYCSSKIGRAHV